MVKTNAISTISSEHERYKIKKRVKNDIDFDFFLLFTSSKAFLLRKESSIPNMKLNGAEYKNSRGLF